jgi:hypothetical protein
MPTMLPIASSLAWVNRLIKMVAELCQLNKPEK